MFPQVCVGCGSLGPRVCKGCLQRARPIERDWCLTCGNEGETTTPCAHCFGKADSLRVLGFWYYEHVVSRAVWSLKYKSDKRIVTDLIQLTTPQAVSKLFCIQKQYTNPVFVPIPLHSEKEMGRGYNQSLFIARALEIFTGIPVVESAIRRSKKTQPQAHCRSREERLLNTKGAFEVVGAELLRGRTTILVDDVITTGATAKEVASELRKHRLSAPHLVCLAREKIE